MNKIYTVAIMTALFALPVWASPPKPTIAGDWKTFDDHTGKPRGIVRITESHSSYFGTAIGSAVAGERSDAVCDKCTGALKNHPMKGLQIIQGVADGPNGPNGGTILDPDSGKIYKVKFTLSNDGHALTVRGYIGTPLFGRSQHWMRVTP